MPHSSPPRSSFDLVWRGIAFGVIVIICREVKPDAACFVCPELGYKCFDDLEVHPDAARIGQLFAIALHVTGPRRIIGHHLAGLIHWDDHRVGDGNQFRQVCALLGGFCRSEEHTSELQSLMRISYAVFCLKTKTKKQTSTPQSQIHKLKLSSK